MMVPEKDCFLLNFGRIDYEKALDTQEELMKAHHSGSLKDVLMLLEHPPVITIGASGDKDNILVEPEILDREGISVYEIDRGGDVTYHGPGQLVGYLVFSLYEKDIHKFVGKIEESIIGTLKEYGIVARSERGVWVEDKKIAAIGLEIKKWTTMHGFALNVDPDMNHFSMINPCGYKAEKLTSLSMVLNRNVPMSEVRRKYVKNFAYTFDRRINEVSLEKIRSHIRGNE